MMSAACFVMAPPGVARSHRGVTDVDDARPPALLMVTHDDVEYAVQVVGDARTIHDAFMESSGACKNPMRHSTSASRTRSVRLAS